MPLSWRHHALIQSLLSRGPLKESEFFKIFEGVSGKDPVTQQQVFNDTLLKINKELEYVQFELRACRNQYDGTVYYGVVNNFGDEESKLGTKYSVPQIALYKAVIEAILQDATMQGSVTSHEALYLRLENQVSISNSSQENQSQSIPNALKSFTLSQKEKTLNDLITDQWLCNTSYGRIGLGVRSFLDLRSWLRSSGTPACDVCNEAGVKAACCASEECQVRIHYYCLKKKFPQKKGSRSCPGCGTVWPLSVFEEELQNEAEPSQQPSSNRSTGKRRRVVKAEAVERVNAETETQVSFEAECNDEVEQNQLHSSGRATRNRLRRAKAETNQTYESLAESISQGPSSITKRKRSSRTVNANAETENEEPNKMRYGLRRRLGD